jgi:hypothetical protein
VETSRKLIDGGPDHDTGAGVALHLAQRAAEASLDAEIFLAGPATGLLDRTVREQLDVGPRSHSRRSWLPGYPSRWRRAEPLAGACLRTRRRPGPGRGRSGTWCGSVRRALNHHIAHLPMTVVTPSPPEQLVQLGVAGPSVAAAGPAQYRHVSGAL